MTHFVVRGIQGEWYWLVPDTRQETQALIIEKLFDLVLVCGKVMKKEVWIWMLQFCYCCRVCSWEETVIGGARSTRIHLLTLDL